MKKKVVSLVLAILLLAIAGFGCYPEEKINELEAEIDKLETRLGGKESQIEEQASQIREFEAEVAKNQVQIAERDQAIDEQNIQLIELTNEKAELEQIIESFREPLPLPQKEVIATIHMSQLYEVIRKYYPKSPLSLSGEFHLVSRENIEEFLAADRTNIVPPCREVHGDLCDILAFRLKDRWAEAGFPPSALGLLKGKREGGEQWRNLFITEEGGELVIYEVIPKYDRLVKIERPDLDTYRIEFSNYDPI